MIGEPDEVDHAPVLVERRRQKLKNCRPDGGY
jgi:hypothetical protein